MDREKVGENEGGRSRGRPRERSIRAVVYWTTAAPGFFELTA